MVPFNESMRKLKRESVVHGASMSGASLDHLADGPLKGREEGSHTKPEKKIAK